METDVPPWYIPRSRTPEKYDFFISKVGEDDSEVIDLKAEIAAISGRRGRSELRCFLDRRDWTPGVDGFRVVRDELLASRHMVVWAIRNYVNASSRGWVWVELAYANLIEERLEFDSYKAPQRPIYPFVAPIFRGLSVEAVARSPLLAYWQRNLLSHPGTNSIAEIARVLVDFCESFQGSPLMPRARPRRNRG